MKVRQEVFDTYWKTACERQNIFFAKLAGKSPPYTTDPIFQNYKFCNVYRASDRVSQFLIKDVIYDHLLPEKDMLFRIFFFRLLNKIETWQALEKQFGIVCLKNFDFQKYSKYLSNIKSKTPIYGNAFILCATKAFGFDVKHDNNLALLEHVFKKTSISDTLLTSSSLATLFTHLRKLPLIGDFMAYQLAIDFNYSPVFNFDENDFTVAGPGAIRGIKKCFEDTDAKSPGYIIKYMVENQDREFHRLGLEFKNLFSRPMHAIDCQGWFCETDKYSRVRFPDLTSSRVRIKSIYHPTRTQIHYFYPPKWGIVY